jgi:signal transduction histidine kinase
MNGARPRRRGSSVRLRLLLVNGLVLAVPVFMLLSFRLFQSQLIRQTETKLLAEAALIGEAFRELLRQERGLPVADRTAVLPPEAAGAEFAPFTPQLDEASPVGPPLPQPRQFLLPGDTPAWRAGERLRPMLERAQVFNLSSARVTDAGGVVVATSGTWRGAVLEEVPEVQAALTGRYSAVTRQRISDEPKPSLGSISSRGDVRVFTAAPLFEDGKVFGVVWMSRTAIDPLKAAWLSRRPLLLALGVSLAVALLLSLLLSRQILRPLRHITASAQAIARGESTAALAPAGHAPAEIAVLGEALTTMQAQLTDRAAYIAEFAANVSHELKSPITSIRGAAELLREEAGEMPAEQRQRFLRNIQADAERMERLVVRLLELARIQSAPEAAQRIEIRPFLSRLVSGYGGQVELAVQDAPESLEMIPDHLESAIRNLLDNAVRHGAGRPVELLARGQGGRVVLSVRDRGPGISEANRKQIFTRFFTTERDHGGTGLGLSIVQAVAQTRGGTVECQTGPEGTTFTLVV